MIGTVVLDVTDSEEAYLEALYAETTDCKDAIEAEDFDTKDDQEADVEAFKADTADCLDATDAVDFEATDIEEADAEALCFEADTATIDVDAAYLDEASDIMDIDEEEAAAQAADLEAAAAALSDASCSSLSSSCLLSCCCFKCAGAQNGESLRCGNHERLFKPIVVSTLISGIVAIPAAATEAGRPKTGTRGLGSTATATSNTSAACLNIKAVRGAKGASASWNVLVAAMTPSVRALATEGRPRSSARTRQHIGCLLEYLTLTQAAAYREMFTRF